MGYCSVCKHYKSMVCASCSNYQGVPDHFEQKAENIRFMLNGCDISFVAEGPADMTLEQLVKQASRIEPDWCACGIRKLFNQGKDGLRGEDALPTEIIFDYEDVRKVDPNAPCSIK